MDITKTILHLFPTARPGVDFSVAKPADGPPVIERWNLEDPQPSQEELASAWPAARHAAGLEQVRRKREPLLRGSDHTQLPDSPYSEEAREDWATYRQALRDLPETLSGWDGVESVTWPTPPEE